ncbi:zinc finger protein 37 [Drosophila subpulchrella]|uniref:zinc finger protein 37 n=1 Tax=Drosophila subpulchrella TaxID=1486046 RepID=UPI0018A16F1B|nr:zinc finger protein 37 [Drosophila subpulchrella]
MSTWIKMNMHIGTPLKGPHAGKLVTTGGNPRRLNNPISVPIYELPEYVCVETKWVTRRYALENAIPVNGLHDPITNGAVSEAPPKSAQQDKLNESTGIFASETAVPRRERAIQTEEPSTKEVGIQCRRDSVEWNLPEDQPKDVAETNDYARFLAYVSENTSMFPNGMLECQICGDIANTLLEHQSHMTVHFGPSALCFNCGQKLGHENLLKRHNLSCPAMAPRKSSMLFKCPHPLCNAMSHSEMQLLHHLRKHSGRKCYRCLQCRRFFKTTTSVLIHRKKEQKCSKAKVLTLFRRHKGLPKARKDPRRCSVCLKRFSSERICLRHRRKCILGHHRQLSKILFKEL